METNDDQIIRRFLESQYVDVLPPQHLKISIMRTIDFMKTLKELCLLYTRGTSHLLRQLKTEGGEK